MNIAVFVSGRGSNLQAILESDDLKGLINVVAVLSDKVLCPAFLIAENYSIPTKSIGNKAGSLNNQELLEFLVAKKVDLIVLAGYLKLIPHEIIDVFRNRIINIHPALLPAFGGKGMYGINVHRAVFESSAKVSGATVHFVDYTYDTGKIVAQRCVDISEVKSPEEIAQKVLNIEHQLLPFVIRNIALNKIKIENNRVVITK
ncbi:MAG: phosphoribosylglycinamide formyltransferase [Ignavibacteriaceae bacterium]|nr:phosphoribosylglycinamide formyltransferase [Ignavibacteriaceae bacterium]